jgi:hypothetical protein
VVASSRASFRRSRPTTTPTCGLRCFSLCWTRIGSIDALMGCGMRQCFNDYEWHGDGVVTAQCLTAFGKVKCD